MLVGYLNQSHQVSLPTVGYRLVANSPDSPYRPMSTNSGMAAGSSASRVRKKQGTLLPAMLAWTAGGNEDRGMLATMNVASTVRPPAASMVTSTPPAKMSAGVGNPAGRPWVVGSCPASRWMCSMSPENEITSGIEKSTPTPVNETAPVSRLICSPRTDPPSGTPSTSCTSPVNPIHLPVASVPKPSCCSATWKPKKSSAVWLGRSIHPPSRLTFPAESMDRPRRSTDGQFGPAPVPSASEPVRVTFQMPDVSRSTSSEASDRSMVATPPGSS